MRTRPLVGLALVALCASGAVPAHAGPKPKPKPITKTYSVNAPVPFVLPPSGPACSQSTAPLSEHRETFKAPAAGTLQVVVTEFTGDWDIGLFTTGDKFLQQGDGTSTPSTNTGGEKETIKYKIKKAMTIYIDVCNFLGGPTAKVTYTFTFL